MYVVQGTEADKSFALGFQVHDAEGKIVKDLSKVDVVLESDNPDAVQVIPDPGGDPRKGTLHFGGPNNVGDDSIANLTCTVKLKDGTLLGSFGDQFTVTAGDPASVTGGTLVVDGLSPVPAPPGPAPIPEPSPEPAPPVEPPA